MDLISEDSQILFDTAIRKLAEQGVRSLEPNGTHCLYLSPDNKRCAIGWLMTDNAIDLYGNSRYGFSRLCEEGFNPGTLDEGLMQHLQDLHDYSPSRNHFREGAYRIARIQKLDTSIISEVLTDEWVTAGDW